MKKIFFLLFFIAYDIFSQEIFISTNKTLQKTPSITTFTQRPTVGINSFVNVNFSKLTNETLELEIFGETFSVNGGLSEVRGINNYTWSGKDINGMSYVFTVLNDDISGFFLKNNKIHRIITIDKKYLLYEVKQEAFPSETCHLEQIIDEKTNNAREKGIDLTTYTCKVRVLFYYTNAAESLPAAGGNLLNFAQSCVDVANTCYQNSNVSARLELVYVQKTGFVENTGDSGASLDAFRITNDGNMDEVHTLRTKYSADLCVLLGSYTDGCGIAYLNSAFATGFSVNHLPCAIDNLTFPHEIGHNFGARHDPFVDANNTPYAYGHGFVNVAAGWRTVMAYNNECVENNTNCTRIPYFSNPSVNYLGQPTGTLNTHDNARVHNERYDAMASLQQPTNIVSLASTDADGLYGFSIAKDKIENISTFNVSSGKKYTFNAANKVELKPGFVAATGSVFKADIAPIVNCGVFTDLNVLNFENNEQNAPKISISNNEFHLNSTKKYTAQWLDVRGEKIEENEIFNLKKIDFLEKNATFLKISDKNKSFLYRVKN